MFVSVLLVLCCAMCRSLPSLAVICAFDDLPLERDYRIADAFVLTTIT